MKKKIFISSVLGAIAVLCLTFAFTDAGRPVNADTALKNKDIVMEEGAAIRTLDPMGIRFTAMIKKSVRATAGGVGMYVCPADLLGEDGMFPARKSELKGMVMEGDAATSEKFIKKVSIPDGNIIEGTGKYDIFRVALVRIQNKNIDREFAAMAYFIDANGNEIFSDTAVTRCISDVAEEALADPESGIEDPSEARTYLEGIKNDSNDVAINAGTTTDVAGCFDKGAFSHEISVDGRKTCTFDLRKKFRNLPLVKVNLKAKASETGIAVCGKNIPKDNFGSFNFAASGDKLNLEITGNGNLYIDNISVSVMNSLELDKISLSGTDAAVAQAELKTLPNGNKEYDSKDCGTYNENDLGLKIGETIPSDRYFVFRFKYNADMEGDGRYFQKEEYSNEGFWFYGQDGKYYATFGDDLKDYTVYKDVEDTPYGSYHGRNGLTTKPDTWYYAVAPAPGNPDVIKHYFAHCHIEISGIYSVDEDFKNLFFVQGAYPGKDYTPLAGEGVRDLGLGVLQDPGAASCFELAEEPLTKYKKYSNGTVEWDSVNINIPSEKQLQTDEYLVMKFKYGWDNGWAADYEGLHFSFNYGDNPPNDPYLQVFDEDGYDYTRYNPGEGNVAGTYHNDGYSTKPDTWYYMLNRAGNPSKFTAGTAPNQHYTIGGVYAITKTVKDARFKKENYPFGFSCESKVLSAGEQFNLDAPFMSLSPYVNNLTYGSSNPQVASVSDQGVITGVGTGECDITVSLMDNPAETDVIKIMVNKTRLLERGCKDIREFPLDRLSCRTGNGSVTYDALTGTATYDSGGCSWGSAGFTTGEFVGPDEYLVLKFRYKAEMEEEGTHYFTPDTYSNEGLWIMGYDYVTPDGIMGSGHAKDYFSIFDENYYDYTLYMRKDGDTSYEGNDLTVPYGSFHTSKGITTKPDIWYYAVAPVKGGYRSITSCNTNLYIEIGGVYAVKQSVRDMFVAQNYPLYINLPYSEVKLNIGEKATPDIAGSSIKTVTSENLRYASSKPEVATVDEHGEIEGKASGTCVITVSLEGGGCDPKTIKVTVQKEFTGTDITTLDLHSVQLEGDSGKIQDSHAALEYKDETNTLLYSAGSGSNKGNVKFTIGGTVPEGQYLVIKFRYTNYQYFDDNIYGHEGLWFRGYGNTLDTGVKGFCFAIFDEDGYDYTIYELGSDTPLGSHHGREGIFTSSDTWYYAVSPKAGNYTGIGFDYNWTYIEMAGIYAVNETVKNEKFVSRNYPDGLHKPQEFVADTGKGESITPLDLSKVEIAGNDNDGASVKYCGGTYNRLQYASGHNEKNNEQVGFSFGETNNGKIGTDDYIVIKFRYFDMVFFADEYSNEGLWMRGYGNGQYFSIFDEDYYDYTLYERKDGDTSYEGNNLEKPYGSFHGTKGITTKRDTWYYAVASVKGKFDYISFYNCDVGIEIAGIYAVNETVKGSATNPGRFKPQNYRTFINLPYGGVKLGEGDEKEIDADIREASIKSLEGKTLSYESSDTNIATVDENGKITGKTEGDCYITVSVKEDADCGLKILNVTVPKTFFGDGGGVASFDPTATLERIGKYQGALETNGSTLTHNTQAHSSVFYSGEEGWSNVALRFNGEVGDGNYLVIKFRYMEDTVFKENSYNNEGLWITGSDSNFGVDNEHCNTVYFSVFDEDGYDYTIYNRDNGTPYGSYHGTNGLTTKPGKWYYAVSPEAGDIYKIIGNYWERFHIEIGGIYAVSGTVKDQKFEPKNYPGFITDIAGEMSVLVGEARNLGNAVVLEHPDSNGPATEYSSSDDNTATVGQDGVVTGIAAGNCVITVTHHNASRNIQVHVLPVPEQDTETLPAGITSLGTDCITAGGAGSHAFNAGGAVHYEAFGVKSSDGPNGSDPGAVSLNSDIDISNDEYLVFKAMYKSRMKFVNGSGNEGLWFWGHRNDAIYSTSNHYDYFSVIGKEDGVYTDYTIYNTGGLPYGSYHNFSDNLTTMPDTWYYFVAPQPGKYTDFGSYFKDADMIIGGVYKMSGAFYGRHIAQSAALPILTYKLETVNPADGEKLGYSAFRERIYAANTDASNEFRLAAEVPEDKYICFEAKGASDFNSLKFTAARGRTYYNFGVFGTDDDRKDYGTYINGDVMQGVSGIHNTLPDTPYYFIAPEKGNFDWFALRGNNQNFSVTIKDVKFISEEERNNYIAVAVNDRAAASAQPGSGDPVITFGVYGGSHIPCDQISDTSSSIFNAEKNFRAALDYFKSKDVDALLLNGDIIDRAADNGNSGKAYETMNNIMDEAWKDATMNDGWKKYRLEAPDHLMYTLGDHEYYYDITPDDARAEWAEAGYEPCQSFEANGYTFISLDISAHGGTIDARTRTVTEKRLAAANAADSDKPIFVTLHIPPKESVPNTSEIVLQDDENNWIQGILETYPQTVMFCSGTGYSIRSPQSINQNKATVINTGSGTYGCVPRYNPLYQSETDADACRYHNALYEMAYAGDIYEEGTITGNYSSLPYVTGYNDLCTGLIVRVYLTGDAANPQHRVDIERVNLLTEAKIGSDWSFTVTNQSSGFDYTKEKQKTHYNSLLPVLSAEGENKCSVAWNGSGDSLVFNLKPSNGNEQGMGDNIVDCYKVEILSGDETLYTKNYVSDYWLTNGYGELKDFEMLVKEENRNKAFTVKIKALDAYGRESNEISFDLGAPSAS